MTDFEAWQVVCHPLPPTNYRTSRTRAITLRMFAVLGVLALVAGALAGLSYAMS